MILLQSMLKLVGAIGNGGEVKSFLAEEGVRVDGVVETRRGRKLYNGAVVEVPGGEAYRIVAEAP